MPEGLSWRHCLVAFLLSVGSADFLTDLREGGSEDSRTGDLGDMNSDSNESDDANSAESLTENNIQDTQETADDGNRDNGIPVYLREQENVVSGGEPGASPSLFLTDPNILTENEDKSKVNKSSVQQQYDQPRYPGGSVVNDKVVFPKDPNYEPDDVYPQDPTNEAGLHKSDRYTGKKLFSKLIPLERHILLSKIPGAQNAIECSKEGELHNFWAPSFQCMVCVCLSSYGRLRPVCVSCSTCLEPPGPPPGPPPYTTIAPPTPPEPTPQPEQVSCAPLPTNVPFQSPLDPCKICVCTETFNERGELNVQINCQHNPQCVVPPYSTPRPPIPTPIPPPVCNEFPQNVPFPHPDDPCKLCKCTVRTSAYGLPEQQIDCYANPECQSTSEPDTEVPEPITEIPEPTPLPGPEICKRYPDNVIFPHPWDHCQVCKCTVHPSLFKDKKKVTCYMRANCIPTTPEPKTDTPIIPEPDCEGYPENLMFPHPLDACKICKCVPEMQFFNRAKKLICYERPECTPTPSPWPVPTTTQPPLPPQPENVRCAPLPTGSPFQNPLNPCQICVCTERVDVYGHLDVVIECQENPQCVQPANVTELPPDIVTPIPLPICKQFPENVYFPHPKDACQVCRCSVINTYGGPKQHISCYMRPECSPTPNPEPEPPVPPTTQEPEPDYLCDRYPLDIIFPHPSDPCKACQCHKNLYQKTKQITCFLRPECSPSPKPTPGPAPEPTPSPETVSCAPFPAGTPFQNPLNPCQTCICTERADLFGRHDVDIECQENSQCVLPPDVTTLPPIVSTPLPLPACKEFPENVLFPHPQDVCQLCKCTIQRNSYGIPEEVISCTVKPECSPITEYPEPTPGPDPLNEICETYPENTPFEDPTDPCRVCMCKTNSSPGASYSIQSQRVQIQCQVKPECSPVPPTSRPEPNPYEVCRLYQADIPFDDPTDPCRICTCIHVYPGSQHTPMQPSYYPVTMQIQCQIKPECLPTPQPPRPPTEEPGPFDICEMRPMNVPFTNPSDPCQVCVCFMEPGLPELPGYSLAPQSSVLKVYHRCNLKPECYSPSPEPIITTSLPPVPVPTPSPNDMSCRPLPSGTPFQNPLNPCQICVCKETVDVFGRPDVNIKCQENPQCVIDPDVSTIPPSPVTPVPLPACAKFPPNVVFPHPQDACQLCKCTVTMNNLGMPEQRISCFNNPDCEVTQSPITIRPEPSMCDRYPPNTVFPLPQDPCRLCRCTVERMPYGGTKQHINCFANPACTIPSPSTPAPRPPAPPGPLPGPAPHESCTPYKPNKPFQHPWDECQVCICTEAISRERITIEVNCYTKPSCCIEPPIDIPGLPGQSGFPAISGSPGSGSIVIGPGSVNIKEPNNEISSPKFPGYPNTPDPSGGNMIDDMTGSNGVNVIEPIGSNEYKSTSGNLYKPNGNLIRPTGENWLGSGAYVTGRNLIRPGGGNLIGPTGESWIAPTDKNVIEASSGNLIVSDGNEQVNNILTESTGVNLINSSDEAQTSGTVTEATGGNVEALDGNPTRHTESNWLGGHRIQSNSGSLITTSGNSVPPNLSVKEYGRLNANLAGQSLSFTRPGENLYVPSHRYKRPVGNTDGSAWRLNQRFLRPDQISKHRPVNIEHYQTYSGGTKNGYITSENGFKDGETPVQNVLTKTEAHASAQAQGADANAEASASVPYRKSTRMRTKSARPRDDDRSEDYD